MPTLDNFLLSNYGLDGPSDNIKRAIGTVTSPASNLAFNTTNGTTSLPSVVVTGLSFRPNVIMVRTTGASGRLRSTLYDRKSNGDQQPSSSGIFFNFAFVQDPSSSPGVNTVTYTYLFNTQGEAVSSGKNGYVSGSGFNLPVGAANTVYEWEALYIPE